MSDVVVGAASDSDFFVEDRYVVACCASNCNYMYKVVYYSCKINIIGGVAIVKKLEFHG